MQLKGRTLDRKNDERTVEMPRRDRGESEGSLLGRVFSQPRALLQNCAGVLAVRREATVF